MPLLRAITRSYIRFILFAGLLAPALAAGTPTAPPPQEKAAADRDFASFEELRLSKPPGKPSDMGWESYVRWGDGHSRSVSAAAIHFYQAHPQDPRRWDVLMAMLNSPPLFAKGFRPDVVTRGAGAAIIDEQAKDQWNTEADRLRSELIAAPDSKPEQREMADFGGLSSRSRALGARIRSGLEHNPHEAWLGLLAGLDEHFSRFAGSPRLGYEVQLILGAWDRIVPGSMQEACLRFAASKDDAVRRFAEEHLKNSDLFTRSAPKPKPLANSIAPPRSGLPAVNCKASIDRPTVQPARVRPSCVLFSG